MITYTINSVPTARLNYDGASTEAKLHSEIFERLIELDEIRLDSGIDLCRRIATLAELSGIAVRLAVKVGTGETAGVMQSYEKLALTRGYSRQALHWQFNEEIRKIKFVFPELAALLVEFRLMSEHHEEPMSAADQLRSISEGRT